MNSELSVGTVIAGLRIEERLASGGAGTTYRAFNPTIGRDECIKVLKNPGAGEAADCVEEAQKASSTGLPGVVTVYSAGVIDTHQWFSMEYSKLGDLRRALPYVLPENLSARSRHERIVALLSEVAGTLDRLHQLSLVHGDIKPGNLLVFPQDGAAPLVKIADFGLSKYSTATRQQAAAPISGTLAYLSPERLNGQDACPESDRYAFACTVFEIFTGTQAFTVPSWNALSIEERITALRKLHASGHMPRASKADASLKPVDRVFLKALAFNPAQRYRSASEFLLALRKGLGIGVSRRKKIGIALAATAALGIAATAMLRSPQEHSPQEHSNQPAFMPQKQAGEQSLPVGVGCPRFDYFKLVGVPGRDNNLLAQHPEPFSESVPHNCVFTPSPESLSEANSLSANPEAIVVYVFNSGDAQTTAAKNEALEQLLNSADTTQETQSVVSDNHAAQMLTRYRTGIPGISNDGKKSTACSLSTKDFGLTIVQINYGFDPDNGFLVGDGRSAESQACGAAIQLVQGWMDDTN